jgi:hypothetical protein
MEPIKHGLRELQQELGQSTIQLLSLQKGIRALRKLDNDDAAAQKLIEKLKRRPSSYQRSKNCKPQ